MAGAGAASSRTTASASIRHAVPRTVTEGDRALYTGALPDPLRADFLRRLRPRLRPAAQPDRGLVGFHIVFGKTVPDISLNAVANLGYAEGRFLRPVYPGDTLSATCEVIGLRETSNRTERRRLGPHRPAGTSAASRCSAMSAG